MKNTNGRVQPQEILTSMREIQITWALKALGRYRFASSRDPLSLLGCLAPLWYKGLYLVVLYLLCCIWLVSPGGLGERECDGWEDQEEWREGTLQLGCII